MYKTASDIADIVLYKLAEDAEGERSHPAAYVGAGALGGVAGVVPGGAAGYQIGRYTAPAVMDKEVARLMRSKAGRSALRQAAQNPWATSPTGMKALAHVLKRTAQGVGGGAALGAGTALGGVALYDHLRNQGAPEAPEAPAAEEMDPRLATPEEYQGYGY